MTHPLLKGNPMSLHTKQVASQLESGDTHHCDSNKLPGVISSKVHGSIYYVISCLIVLFVSYLAMTHPATMRPLYLFGMIALIVSTPARSWDPGSVTRERLRKQYRMRQQKFSVETPRTVQDIDVFEPLRNLLRREAQQGDRVALSPEQSTLGKSLLLGIFTKVVLVAIALTYTPLTVGLLAGYFVLITLLSIIHTVKSYVPMTEDNQMPTLIAYCDSETCEVGETRHVW
jgi:hypothetical protein